MGKQDQSIFRPSDLRRAVSEWVTKGFSVRIGPDGMIEVKPAEQPINSDPFDMVNLKR
ncbi:hypothetical protein [Thioclava sp. GXIMD4216]|uniref:Uncharacterized protein n=1 Tax=Thioclava kandeliae TaxID=3070818 RepID=A0ABV1SIB4_9RHOB